MIKIAVTYDLRLAHISVTETPLGQHIEYYLSNTPFAMTIIAYADGHKVAVDNLCRSIPSNNNWVDYGSTRIRSELVEFINTTGYFVGIKKFGKDWYYTLPNGKRCPICAKVHNGEITNKPYEHCSGVYEQSPMVFDIPVHKNRVILI